MRRRSRPTVITDSMACTPRRKSGPYWIPGAGTTEERRERRVSARVHSRREQEHRLARREMPPIGRKNVEGVRARVGREIGGAGRRDGSYARPVLAEAEGARQIGGAPGALGDRLIQNGAERPGR